MSVVAPGTVIDDRYRVVRLLGEGGFGAVYLAQDTRLGEKTVALKEGFDRSAAAQEQFRLEAQLLADLSHPGLPRVTDFFIEKDGRQFLVMDYVEGEDLDKWVLRSAHPIPQDDAVAVMLQVCEAVAYLHTRRPQPIIHRDIKPPNIKITRDGRAVLVDFGIAKVYHPSKGTARVAKAVTPHFSPPEQHTAHTDTRSDVYALGATLYFLITADVPPDAMNRLNQGVLVIPPTRLNPAVSPALEQVALKSLELLPDHRFQSANRLTVALRAVKRERPAPGQASKEACPRCGWHNRAGARYCARDGTPLVALSMAEARPGGGSWVSTPSVQALGPEMLFESANDYARNREYARAIAHYEASMQKGFDVLALYHNLGICYLEVGRFGEAAGVLERGATQYPQDGDLQCQLARAYTRLNLPEKAIAAASQACSLSPDDVANLRLYSELLFEVKRYSQAAQQLERAVRLQPNSLSLKILLGKTYGEARDLRRAAQAFQRAARFDPSSPEPHYWSGFYYQRAGKNRKARSALKRALRIDPNYQPAQDLLKNV